MSAYSHSYLAPAGGASGGGGGGASSIKSSRNKLRREDRERSVLPPLPPPGGQTYTSAYSYGGVGRTGYQAYGLGGAQPGASAAGTAAQPGRLQQRIDEVKERQKERRERHQSRRKPDEISKRNLVVDENGVGHDSEYVQFRTATPVHVQARTAARQNGSFANDDDSASSSGSSSCSSSESGFESSPYTYQSTHRTTASTHHSHHSHHQPAYPSTISAIPPYLAGTHRTSIDQGPSSLSVPRAPSPSNRRPSSDYDRIPPPGRTSTKSSKLRSTSSPMPQHQFSTSSYQPPAAFNPRPAGFGSASGVDAPLRLPPKPQSSDANSLTDSTARMSLSSTAPGGGANESGYNKYASTRPPKLDGSALDAGVHGMKRSWDGFKLDMRFGAHKLGKKVSRKVNSALG
ncbi:hypothetical protein JCM5296_005101 [Sporobolomyces johnsonii]